MSDDLFPGIRLRKRKDQKQAIIELWKAHGRSAPLRALAEEAVRTGVISADELSRLGMRALQELCREALKDETASGLPLAKPIASGPDAPWSDLDLFGYDQAVDLLDRELEAIGCDQRKWLRLHQWCFDKFNRAPKLPDWNDVATLERVSVSESDDA